MKSLKSKFALLALALAGMVALPAHADLTQSWTASGGAWDRANQPGWTWTDDPNPLYSDQGAGSGAVLFVTDMATVVDSRGAPDFGNSGPLVSFFYTKGSNPSFSLTATTVVAGLETISFAIDYADISMTPIADINLSLNFSSAYSSLAPDGPGVVVTSFEEHGFGWTRYLYTWDVSQLGGTSGFSVNWGALAEHTAFTAVFLTQTSAVPEPAAWAAISASAVLAAALLRRRGSGRS